MQSELKFAKKGIEMFASMGLGDQTQGGAAYEPEPEEERFLYDVVFSKTDPTFKGASKTRRDTLNKTAHNTDRRMGGMSTVNALTFTAAPQYEKPEHGRTRLLQESFYRKTNVVFPGGSAAAMD